MKDLENKVAVVTGGSGGIGIEIGRAMLAKGMNRNDNVMAAARKTTASSRIPEGFNIISLARSG